MSYYDAYSYDGGYGEGYGGDYDGGYGGGGDYYRGRREGQALVPYRGRDNRPPQKPTPEYEKNYQKALRNAAIQKELDITKATSDLQLAKAQAQLVYNEAKLVAAKIREEGKKKNADGQYAKLQREVDEQKGKKASGEAGNDDGT